MALLKNGSYYFRTIFEMTSEGQDSQDRQSSKNRLLSTMHYKIMGFCESKYENLSCRNGSPKFFIEFWKNLTGKILILIAKKCFIRMKASLDEKIVLW